MNLDEVLHHRRSVRVYDKEKPIDTEKVKHCLELATLAPTVLICNYGNFTILQNLNYWQKFQGTALVRKRLLPLHKLSFLWFGVTGTRNMRDSYSILNGRTFVVTVLKNVRPNVLRIGKYITVY